MAIYFCIYMFIGFVPLFINKLTGNPTKRRKFCVWIGFFSLFLLFALRHPSMGGDLGFGTDTGYLARFDQIAQLSWKEAFQEKVVNYERGYILLNKLVGSIWNNEQFFLAICALCSILPCSYVLYKKSVDTPFSYIVYMGLPAYMMLFSGLRQGLAIGFCFLSILFIEDKKWLKFIITVWFASLFHQTAIIFLIAYPLYHFKMGYVGRLFSLLLLPIVFLLRTPLFLLLSKILKEDALPDDNGAITLLLVFCVIYVFCFLFARKNKQLNGYLNLFYIACICQVFGNIYSTAMRVGYYFMMAAVLLIPRVINELDEEKNVKQAIKITVILAFVAFGLYSIYTSSWAEAYPYYWFWRNI